MIIRKILRTNGTSHDLAEAKSMEWLRNAIGADTLDVVQLRHLGYPRHVMLVDDAAYAKDLPVNVEATKLYLANCKPGTTHQIRGDVAVVVDDDFGGPL